jgi:ribonuclease HII
MPRFNLKPDAEVSKSTAKMRLLKRLHCTTKHEKTAWQSGAQFVCGIDEVGRGSLFGPVVAGAVILDPNYRIRGLRDSKLLKREGRETLAQRIKEHCVAWAVAAVDAARIDQINIYHASRMAMVEAIASLSVRPDFLLVDALKLDFECQQRAIIHGDAVSASIAAASIVAKVHRDAMIDTWDPIYPMYGLKTNKGYYTQKHSRILREHGPSPLHRMSFAPVWNAGSQQEALAFVEAVEETLTGVQPEGGNCQSETGV